MFMPVPDEDTAMTISRAIQKLSVPKGEPRTTEFALGWQNTPDGRCWLQWQVASPLPIWPSYDSELADILQSFVTVGQLTAESAAGIKALIAERLAAAEGGVAHVTLEEATPPEWQHIMIADETFAAMYSSGDNLFAPLPQI